MFIGFDTDRKTVICNHVPDLNRRKKAASHPNQSFRHGCRFIGEATDARLLIHPSEALTVPINGRCRATRASGHGIRQQGRNDRSFTVFFPPGIEPPPCIPITPAERCRCDWPAGSEAIPCRRPGRLRTIPGRLKKV